MIKTGSTDSNRINRRYRLESSFQENDHNMKGAASAGMLAWYKNGLGGPVAHADPDLVSPYDWSAGGNQAHNNMPPYVVLLNCTKT